MFELAIVIVLVFAVCMMAYRGGGVNEFQILQREYAAQTPWDELLGERLPVVIRALPKSLQGAWSLSRTATKRWPVLVHDAENARQYKTTWDAYVDEGGVNQLVNTDEIARIAKLDETLQNWTADGFHKWYWVPTGAPTPIMAPPSYVRGVSATVADATVLTNTDGGALHIWLAHAGAIPANVVPALKGKNPWVQTTDDIPWISEVKYVEVILRPGNALLIPRHWYYAVSAAAPMDPATPQATWYWIGEFHSPMSWLVGAVTSDGQISHPLNL